jgi:RNA polymerase sigma-70 factor (ECF subfamily)
MGAVDFRRFPSVNGDMLPAGEAIDAGQLFDVYHDRIYRYVLRMVKNPAEAEDLTQDTFLRAYRGHESLRDPQAVRGWLYRIATHACLDRLRQRKPQVSIDTGEGADRVNAVVSKSPSVLEITERKETSACVQRCLDFLPDSYRAVILLHEAHSLTAAEIAELLGVTVTTVKIRLHRARRKLQRIMEYGCAVSKDSSGLPVCQPKS